MKILSILLVLGWFSVSADKQVCFAPGNLQFNASEGTHQTADGLTKDGTWRFADSQWERAQSPWFDIFAWATSGWDNTVNDLEAKRFEPTEINTVAFGLHDYNYYGYGPSYGAGRSQDLTGNSANHDWGIYNAISNGGDEAGKWRTLTYAEWDYLLNQRTTGSWDFAYIKTPDSIAGIVILPDDWQGEAIKEGYTAAEWTALETQGAVFLPEGEYWTATGDPNETNKNRFAIALFFNEGTNNDPQDIQKDRYTRLPVRLVQDYKEPDPAGFADKQAETINQKTLHDGQLLILQGENLFNTLGQKVH